MSTAPGVQSPARAWAWLALAVIVLLGAHLRLSAALRTEVDQPLRGDAALYTAYAYNLDRFGVFSREFSFLKADDPALTAPAPDAFVAPGYPWFLSWTLEGAPDMAFVTRTVMIQAILGIVLLVLGFLVTRGLLDEGRALIVTGLLAISPHLIVLGTYLLTETVYAISVAALALALIWATRARRVWVFALVGVVLGVSVLIRPTLQYLPPFLALGVILFAGWRRWPAALALVLGFALVFTPWLARNQSSTGQTGDPKLMIATLQHGSYPGFMYNDLPESRGYPYRFDPETPRISASLDAVLGHIADRFRAEPARMTRWYLLEKPFYFHDWSFIEGAGDVFLYPVKYSPYFDRPEFKLTRAVSFALHWPLVMLGMGGCLWALWRAWRARGAAIAPTDFAWGLLALVQAYAIGLHMVGAPFGRYSVPFRVLLFPFAVYAASAIIAAIRRRTTA